jgi:hypothetical protein
MSLVSRWLIVPASALLIVAVVMAKPGSREEVSDDEWKNADPETRAIRDQMDSKQQSVSQRIAYKEALITELIAGRTTLHEVSQEFLALNREVPSAMFVLRWKFQVESDEEVSALNVIDFVTDRVSYKRLDPRILQDIEQQFIARFGHKSTVVKHH